MRRTFVLCFLGLVAQQASAATWDVCHADVDKLCPGSQHTEGDMIRCLHPNEEKLSAPCKAHFQERKRVALKDWPCAADAERLCKHVKNEPGKMGECLFGNQKKLSPKCKAFHKRTALKMHELQQKALQDGAAPAPGGSPAYAPPPKAPAPIPNR